MRNKVIPAHLFQADADYHTARYFAVLPAGFTFEDLFQPSVWANFGGVEGEAQFKQWDVVRVVHVDGDFDVDLCVANVQVGAVRMKVRPFYKEASAEAAIKLAQAVQDTNPNVVPMDREGRPIVRVEHLAATGWRVIGLAGEVSRDHKSEKEATKAMNLYLKNAGLRMPTEDEMRGKIAA